MEEKYWKQFLETGKITDYLYYKGMQICSQVMDRYESDKTYESDHSDRDGACSDTCRGI